MRTVEDDEAPEAPAEAPSEQEEQLDEQPEESKSTSSKVLEQTGNALGKAADFAGKMLGGITVYAEDAPEGESEQPESVPPADDKNNAALEGLVKVMKPVAVCGIITGALAVSVAHPTTTPLMAVGAKVAVDAVLSFEVKKPNAEANTDGAEVEQLPATEETDEQATVPEVLEEEVHAHLLKEMPDGLPLPNVPRKPNWWEIGWRRLMGRSINDTIWDRWFPPEPSNYVGQVRPCGEPAGLGEVNDEELNRLDEAIKSSALGGREYVKFAYLCEMLPEPIKKYRKMIHEFIPEVIEQAYGKEKESLHVGGFIGALLGFKTGLVDDLPRNLCRDALELLFDPLGTVCDIVDSVMPNNPDNCVAQIMRAWQSGDDFSRGRIVGNITGQVAIIVASKKFSAKVTSGRALEAASAASEVGSAAGVAEVAGEAAAVAREAQSAAKVAKSAEAASKVASVAKETQSAASVAKSAEAASKAASVAKEAQSVAKVAKEAETVAKSTAGAAKSAETVAKGAKAASGAGTAAKEAKGAAETAKSAATTAEKFVDTGKGTAGSTLGKMSAKDAVAYREWNYEKIRELSVKNPDADSMTLGKYVPGEDGKPAPTAYTEMAKKTGDTYFDLGMQWGEIEEAYTLTDTDMFDLFNTSALDKAVQEGKTIRFTHNPTLEIYKDSALADEWRYLISKHGYKKLEPGGDYWYAIRKK